MKHFGWSAVDFIAWNRIVRPGSVIGQPRPPSRTHTHTTHFTLNPSEPLYLPSHCPLPPQPRHHVAACFRQGGAALGRLAEH